MADDPYVYPGTDVLRNHFGIRDADRLSLVEASITTARLALLGHRSLPGRYDLDHLRAFHRAIFSDVYSWAGELRSVAIAKDQLFALPSTSSRTYETSSAAWPPRTTYGPSPETTSLPAPPTTSPRSMPFIPSEKATAVRNEPSSASSPETPVT